MLVDLTIGVIIGIVMFFAIGNLLLGVETKGKKNIIDIFYELSEKKES